jgi:hypothetical protein
MGQTGLANLAAMPLTAALGGQLGGVSSGTGATDNSSSAAPATSSVEVKGS